MESQKGHPLYTTLHNTKQTHWTIEEQDLIINAFDVLKNADKQTLENLLESQSTCEPKVLAVKNVEMIMMESDFRQKSELLLDLFKKKLPKACKKIIFEVILEDTSSNENEIFNQKKEKPVLNSKVGNNFSKDNEEFVDVSPVIGGNVGAIDNSTAVQAKDINNKNESVKNSNINNCEAILPVVDVGKQVDVANQGVRYVCVICNLDFADQNGTNRHWYIKHGKTQRKYCALCESSYWEQKHLDVHYRNKHKFNMLHKCRICCTQFKQFQNLKSHFNDHHSSKPFQCKQCQKVFGKLAHRNRHQAKCNKVT